MARDDTEQEEILLRIPATDLELLRRAGMGVQAVPLCGMSKRSEKLQGDEDFRAAEVLKRLVERALKVAGQRNPKFPFPTDVK